MKRTQKLERLSAECPRHGRVRIVCPKCAGKIGGMMRRGRGHRQQLRIVSELERAEMTGWADSEGESRVVKS